MNLIVITFLLNFIELIVNLNFLFTKASKPKSEMTPEELQKLEEEEFNTGPLSVLTQYVKI